MNTPGHGAQRTCGGACISSTNSKIFGRQTAAESSPARTSTHGETFRYESVDYGDEPTVPDPATLQRTGAAANTQLPYRHRNSCPGAIPVRLPNPATQGAPWLGPQKQLLQA
jgi:hypothetical protein|uniref:Uncharacterized protein n=1 Tax=Zea mays TaxID=4577 RepID=C0PCZ5_MAIZE|nr:unknown [Zea mays]